MTTSVNEDDALDALWALQRFAGGGAALIVGSVLRPLRAFGCVHFPFAVKIG